MSKEELIKLEDRITEQNLMDQLIETADGANIGEATVYRAFKTGPTTKKRRIVLRKAMEMLGLANTPEPLSQ